MRADLGRKIRQNEAADWLSAEISARAKKVGADDETAERLGEIVGALTETTTDNRETYLKIDDAETLEFLKKRCEEPAFVSLTGTPKTFEDGEISSLVFDEENSALYFFRHYKQERETAEKLLSAVGTEKRFSVSSAAEKILTSPQPFPLNAEQQKAVRTIISSPISIISGGPGTGKTTLLLRALLCILSENPDAKILLAAPTGKAAARMKESIRGQVGEISERGIPAEFSAEALRKTASLETATLHRILKNGASPLATGPVPALAADFLIADEASMIDQSLAHRLLCAISPKTRLVLLGDENQLDSVGAGHVFGAICAEPKLRDVRVALRESRRFSEQGVLGRLARAIVSGDVSAAAEVIDTDSFSLWDGAVFRFSEGRISPSALDRALFELFPEKLRRVPEDADPEEILGLAESVRLLTPLRNGEFGVTELNVRAERLFARERNLRQTHFHGQPIIITKNAPQERLFNGDVGVVLFDRKTGTFSAYFRAEDGGLRRIPAALLPVHETAYAMSIHKSQGSEFSRLAVIFPPAGTHGEFFSRQLLYTAVTRFRESGNAPHFHLLFDRETLLSAVARAHPQTSLLFSRTEKKVES